VNRRGFLSWLVAAPVAIKALSAATPATSGPRYRLVSRSSKPDWPSPPRGGDTGFKAFSNSDYFSDALRNHAQQVRVVTPSDRNDSPWCASLLH